MKRTTKPFFASLLDKQIVAENEIKGGGGKGRNNQSNGNSPDVYESLKFPSDDDEPVDGI